MIFNSCEGNLISLLNLIMFSGYKTQVYQICMKLVGNPLTFLLLRTDFPESGILNLWQADNLTN